MTGRSRSGTSTTLTPKHRTSSNADMKPPGGVRTCLLYTSPSPRDGHLSIRRQASDVYKRQDIDDGPVEVWDLDDPDPEASDELKRRHEAPWWGPDLSLIHISEPTRRTPLYSSASVRCV